MNRISYLPSTVAQLVRLSMVLLTGICTPLTLAGLVLVLTSASAAAQQCELHMHIPLKGDISFSPHKLTYSNNITIGDNLFITLVTLDQNANIKPMLAKSWVINKQDKNITFYIDNSCHWSTGHKITAKDMADGIRLLFTKPDDFVVGRSRFKLAREAMRDDIPLSEIPIDVIDDHTLRLYYTGSAHLFLLSLTQLTYTPKPNQWLKKNPISWPSYKILPVSSGAFRLSSEDKDIIKLKKNNYFCASYQHALESVKISKGLTQQRAMELLLTGDLDLKSTSARMYRKSVEAMKEKSTDGHHIKIMTDNSFRGGAYIFLFINQFNEKLKDKRVKEAIRLAINHELILKSELLESTASRIHNYSLSYGNYTSPTLPATPIDYDTRLLKARQLMSEAGYSENNPLKIDIPLRTNHVFYNLARSLAGMLNNIYIESKLRETDEGPEYYTNMDRKTFDLALFLWRADIPDPSNIIGGILDKQIASDEIYQPWYKKIIHSNQIEDSEERYAILNKLEQEIREVGHIIPLYYSQRFWLSRKPVHLNENAIVSAKNILINECP